MKNLFELLILLIAPITCHLYYVPATLSITGGGFSTPFVNEIIKADKTSGVDMGTKICNSIAALPSTGGIVDARSFTGVQNTVGCKITLANVKILFGQVNVKLTSAFEIDANNVTLEGAGPGVSILTNNSTTVGLCSFKPLLQGDDVVRTSTCASSLPYSGIVLRNLEINGNRVDKNAGGIPCDNGNITAAGCALGVMGPNGAKGDDISQNGFNDTWGSNITLENVWVHDNWYYGAGFDGNGGVGHMDSQVRGGQFYNNGAYGLAFNGAVSNSIMDGASVYSNGDVENVGGIQVNGLSGTINNDSVLNCTVRANTNGGIILNDTSYTLVSNNHVSGTLGTGIAAADTNKHEVGIKILGNDISGFAIGINIGNSSITNSQFQIIGNTVRNFSAKGISSAAANQIIIMDNIVDTGSSTSPTDYGIGWSGSNATVVGNKVYNIASVNPVGFLAFAGSSNSVVEGNYTLGVAGTQFKDLGTNTRIGENFFGKTENGPHFFNAGGNPPR